jgi:hypothetical protein
MNEGMGQGLSQKGPETARLVVQRSWVLYIWGISFGNNVEMHVAEACGPLNREEREEDS